jgi:hypothetical protein
MATTYSLISSVTVGSGGTGTIEFSSIPATYTDLVVNLSGRCDADDFNVYLRFNSSTSNYTQIRLQGTGSAAESATDTNILMLSTRSSYTATTFSNGAAYIPNYAGSTNKSVSIDTVTENNATVNRNILNAGLWSDTTAISNIKLVSATGNFVQHSTAYLYGISNA